MDGEPYHIDLTWDDQISYIAYHYFGLTTEELESELCDHVINYRLPEEGEDAEEGDLFEIEIGYELPECTATENNYYVKEGIFLTEENKDDPELLAEIKKRSKEDYVSLNFNAKESFDIWYSRNSKALSTPGTYSGYYGKGSYFRFFSSKDAFTANGQYEAMMFYNKKIDEGKEIKLIQALYDDNGRLLGAKTVEMENPGSRNMNMMVISPDVLNVGHSKVRYYFWSTDGNIIPFDVYEDVLYKQ